LAKTDRGTFLAIVSHAHRVTLLSRLADVITYTLLAKVWMQLDVRRSKRR
jgi:hypothetical protein